MIRFVFFDLGNTVVDYHRGPLTDEEKDELGLELIREKLREWNRPVSYEVLRRRFYDKWTEELFPKRGFRKREFSVEELLAKVLNRHDTDMTSLVDLFHEPSRRYAMAMDGIAPVLEEIRSRGRGTGIISNTPIPGSCHDVTLKRLGLLDYFSPRLYSYDEGIRKPFEEIFLLARERSGCELNEMMMVGDSYRADVEVPASLGMGAVLFDPDDRHVKAPCTRIREFSEILDYIGES